MSLEVAFSLISLAFVPAWSLLIFAPKWKWTDRLVHRMWIPAFLCLAWLGLLVFKPSGTEGGGIGSLAEFMTLLDNPYSVLLIWLQLLTWDLFIGAWELRDAQRRGIAHYWMVPCLLATFLLGPAGLLAYLGVRFALEGTTTLHEGFEARAAVAASTG